MSEIVLKGSITVWKDTNNYELYNKYDILRTKPHVPISSPQFGLESKTKLLVYEPGTWTIEYSRSYLPIWFVTSFIGNLINFDSMFRLITSSIDCFSQRIHSLISKFTKTMHDCCSHPFTELF